MDYQVYYSRSTSEVSLDGMPVNFKFPLDASSLLTDFEVIDSLGNIHTPICAFLAQLMKTEKIELCFC